MSLIVIDARESGTTTGRYMDKLIEYIAKTDPDYDFNILAKPHRIDYLRKIAPKYTVIETNAKEFTFAEQTKFLREIKDLDADLVHFPMVQQPILYRGAVVTTMQDLTGVRFKNPDKNPVIYAVKQSIYKWVNRVAAKKSRQIITPSEFVKKDVIKFTGQPAGKFTVTYEAADKIKDKAEPFKKLLGKKFILYVGRPTPHKNLNRLIEAYEILKVKYPDLNLVLAGKKDFNYEQTEARAKDKNIKDIIFTDFVSEGKLRWLYENCAAYIFPSLSEGFGLPGLEAMVHGAPVVSSNATCLPEIYGDAAEYFDPLDIGNMADAISKVLKDEKLRAELIKKGYKQASKYSWERMAKQTLAVYERVLDT
ncbi:MAG TPA: glycosyltransferase family 1 protein [Candidatus Saccharimonadales bacterium]|jgi:glycosyltransferase involved in cell wall biosynthesis